jgi:acylphosphatase
MIALIAKRFYVSGRVQGVFFRASTRAQATQLGIEGWALNMDDGRVEVLAVGPEPQLDSLAAWLAVGPSGAQVAAVEVEQLPYSEFTDIEGFRCG